MPPELKSASGSPRIMGRRLLFAASGALLVARTLGAASADAPTAQPSKAASSLLSPRVLGSPNAKVIVDEWFSLTCSHCAHFSKEIFPRVRKNLIDTGKIRYRFHDFPIDQVALLAAMVARSLPVDRYEPFVTDLLDHQDQWAFAQNIDPVAELKKRAALFGISAQDFDRINADDTLREAIIDRQDRDSAFLQIPGTPYFRINDAPAPDVAASYDNFAKAVEKAS